MILPGFISKILAAFRGGIAPGLIFLSVLLGFWIGMIPGFSGIHIALLILILLLNAPLTMVIFWALTSRGLCYAVAPLLYHCGKWIHTNVPSVIRILDSIPVIGLTDFNTFAIAGGLFIGPVIGAVAGFLMLLSVVKFRQMMLKLDQNSEAFRKWHSKTWVYILDRILIGKRTKDVKALFTAKTKYIRKAGIVLVVLVVAASIAAGALLKNSTVKNRAAGAMTSANGAQVDLNNLDISLSKGFVSASGIEATNPQNPANNQLSIASLSADADIYNLLLGKLILDKVEISDVRFDQKRSSPGKVVEKEVVAEKEEPFDPNKFQVGTGDIARLETYIKDAKAWKEKLQKLRKYLPSGSKEETVQVQTPQKYLDYLTAQFPVLASARMIAKQAIMDKVQIPSVIFGSSKIELANLSDAPKAYGQPVTLSMNSLETGAKTNVTMDYSGQTPKITGTFTGIDMSKVQTGLASDSGLAFESGTASGDFSGTLTKEYIDLTIGVSIGNLKAKAQGKSILGLDSKTVSEALASLDNLKTTLRVVGSVTEPRLVFDVKGLTEQFKQALIKAGKDKLADEVNKQIEKQLGDQVPQGIKETIQQQDVLKGLGGLLGGRSGQ
jgi:uncharacterized protein (TIGR03546 family)